jgi:integration host factor subunit beta
MNTTGSMTKAELVEEVSRVSDLTKKHSEVIVDTVFKSIIDALHRGEKIELRGFGSFRLRRREPRKGRNPKTGDKVDVPPKKVPYFKPGKELKELINREPTRRGRRPAVGRRRRRRRVTLDRLYTPWRLAYVTGAAKSSDCVFCAAVGGTDADPLIVLRGATCFVILNLFPTTTAT